MSVMKKFIGLTCFVLGIVAAHAETGTVEKLDMGTYSITTNDFGNGKYTVITVKIPGVVSKSDISLFKPGSTIISECLGSSTSDSSGTKAEGTCLSTDADGDKYKVNFSRTNSTGGTNPGTQNWVGLTGKYVGMTASCTYENKSQVLNSVVYGFNNTKCNVTK
jgi:hypothetical protein